MPDIDDLPRAGALGPVHPNQGRTRRTLSWNSLGRARFPLIAFAVWRAAHAAVTVLSGGEWWSIKWDAQAYRTIARHGYHDPTGEGDIMAFFPLASWLARGLGALTGLDAAMFLVATISAAAAVVLVHAVVREWKDATTANAAVVALLVFPGSLFLWEFYNEAPMVALCAGALLAQRRGHLSLAVVLAAVSCMARPTAALVIPAMMAAEFEASRRITLRTFLPTLAIVGLVPVGLAMHFQAGDALAVFGAQAQWERELSLPFEGVFFTLSHFDEKIYGDGLDVVLVPISLVVAWLIMRGPWPWAAKALVLGTVVTVLCTGTLMSYSRLMLGAWPAFAVVGDAARRQGPIAMSLIAAGALISASRLVALSTGTFVG